MKLIDLVIHNHSFYEWINQMITIQNEEQEEKAIWELWLHKVFDQSFADFKGKLMIGEKDEATKKEDIERTLNNSFDLLNGFVPDMVQENDGTVSAAGYGSD